MALFNFNIYYQEEKVLKEIKRLKTFIMNSIEELTTKVDNLQIALDQKQEQIATAISQLKEAVEAANANAAEAGTPEQRQALADKLDTILNDLNSTATE